MSGSNDLFDVRVKLLFEEMTKADKKSVEKMIQKALKIDSSGKKKEFQKLIKDEISSKKVKKMISDIVADEISSGLDSSENRQRVADVTKLVLRKLYRELAYNYTPVIDRIKI